MSEKDNNPQKRIDDILGEVGHLATPSEDDVKTSTGMTDLDVTEDNPDMEAERVTLQPKDLNVDEKQTESDALSDNVGDYDDDGSGKSKKLWYILGAVVIIIAVLGGVYAFLSRPLSDAQKNDLYSNGTFVEGISVFDVDVSGDTIAVAREKLSGKVDYSDDQVLLELRLKDQIIPVKAGDLQVENTVDMVLHEAMLYGKEGHLIKRMMDRSDAKKNGKNFDVSIHTDEKSLETLVNTIVEKYSVAARDADVTLASGSGERFAYTEEQVGLQINPEGLAQKIKEHVEDQSSGYLDLDYTETLPKITVEELRKNMTLRSAYTTTVSGATGRRKNVALAANKINGKKVMPGEEFNIEQELGPRTAANGWSIGGEFVNGELVNGYGGGICQASSTLFNAVIRADLEVVKRSNHSQSVGYVTLGFDATISSGGPYFIWKNNTNYPIYIFASGGMSKLTIELYGAPLPYGDNITFEEKVSASGTITSGRKVQSSLVFYNNGKEVHRISWSSSYRGKPTQVTTTKATTAATTAKTNAPATTAPTTKTPTTAPTTKATTKATAAPTTASTAKPVVTP